MSKTILGLSAFYHDAAAALVRGGEIIAAAQEERFLRKKHDPRFPVNAVNYCLEEAFIETDELDAVVFYDNPVLTVDRIFKSLVSAAPQGLEIWESMLNTNLGIKLFVTEYIKKSLKLDAPVLFTEHHAAHAASAFYPSPFQNAATLTLDGVGEWATTTVGHGTGADITILKQINFPHSLGLLYSAFTYFCGFKVNSGEYKLMGLAPYGEPKYAELIKDKLIHVLDDGSFRLNMEYFGYLESMCMTNMRFETLFGGPARQPETPITRREMDMAASVQKVTEEVVVKSARYARDLTGEKNLVMAGGVALNCVANGILLHEKIFDNIWIQPAAGDAGGSLGAALLVNHMHFKQPRVFNPSGRDIQKGSYLGPAFSSDEIRAFLDKNSYPYTRIEDCDARFGTVAQAMADGKVVGYFSGRMEFGPRALGARSIIGDVRNPKMQSNMNLKIKYRESFRPFAPSVLVEDCNTYFQLDEESPYMLLVAQVQPDRQVAVEKIVHENMLEIVNQTRSDIPAVTHVDYSARIQTVHPDDKPDFHALISKFKELTGYGIIVNTSFNLRGEPIVCSPLHAYRCFMRTKIDVLVLEDCILYKENQPKTEKSDAWRQEYELD